MRTSSDNAAEQAAAREADEPVERDDEACAGEAGRREAPRASRRSPTPRRAPCARSTSRRRCPARRAPRRPSRRGRWRSRPAPAPPSRRAGDRSRGSRRAAGSRARRHDVERAAGLDERERQVAVDVGVHPRERELDRGDPASRARLEQRRPRARRPLRPEHVRPQRAQVEVREDDVEPAREPRVGERPRPHALVDRLGDGAIEGGERAHAVLLAAAPPRSPAAARRRRRHARAAVRAARPRASSLHYPTSHGCDDREPDRRARALLHRGAGAHVRPVGLQRPPRGGRGRPPPEGARDPVQARAGVADDARGRRGVARRSRAEGARRRVGGSASPSSRRS